MFSLRLGRNDVPDGICVNRRIAVRAVIMDGDAILLVRTKRGDYKLPGGAVKAEETFEGALRREVAEETGYVSLKIEEELGTLVQQRADIYEQDKFFRMESHYFKCILKDKKNTGQCLDENEKRQEIVPLFVKLHEAAASNRKLLNTSQLEKYDWVERETLVLEELALQDGRQASQEAVL